ncbi:MAG: ABC transporter substrate-binding protein [Dehalococcoidales bacterium]|nr:ABC transporter substrate-binding protein [Dehalococcoidales bacterium]
MKKGFWILATLLIITSLMAASCNKPDTTSNTTTPATIANSSTVSTTTTAASESTTVKTTTATTVSATAANQPKYGGFLRYAYGLEPSSLDPQTGNSGGDAYYWKQMYDHIIASDSQLVPDASRSLAESWEFPDTKTMIFHLRKDVKFHDGTPFDAAAVKFNIERIQDPATASAARASFLTIDKVEIINSTTVKFLLKTPWSAGVGLFADRGGTMNSPTAVAKWGKSYNFHPVGTGPFMLDDYVSGGSVSMVKNPYYWGKDKNGNALPYTDGLRALIITDATTLSAALETGKLDLAFIPNKDVKKFQAKPEISTIKQEGTGVSALLYFNLAKAPMDDINLRKAVSYAIDWEAINQAIFYGNYSIADAGMWLPGTWVYDNTVPRPQYDLAKAKQFLAKSSKPSGFSMDCLTWGNDFTQATQMVQSQLSAIGININVKVYDVGTATAKFFATQEAPFFFSSWSRYPEPDWIAGNNFKSTAYYNPGKLPNATVDDLIAQGAAEYDITKRKAIYRQIQTIVSDECWVIPGLYGVTYCGYWNAKVAGVENMFGWDAKMDLRWVWLK